MDCINDKVALVCDKIKVNLKKALNKCDKMIKASEEFKLIELIDAKLDVDRYQDNSVKAYEKAKHESIKKSEGPEKNPLKVV